MNPVRQHIALFFLLAVFCGCRALPDKNYLGMDRDQVVAAIADTPKLRDQYWVMIPCLDSPREKNRTIPTTSLYYTSLDQLRQDPNVQKTTVIAVDYHPHWSGRNFYYVLTLQNDIVVRQQAAALSDGLDWPCYYRVTNLDAQDELPDDRVIEIARRSAKNLPVETKDKITVARDNKCYWVTFADTQPIRLDRKTLQITPLAAGR